MAHPLSRTDVRIGLIVSAVAVAGAVIAIFALGEERTVRPLGRLLSISVQAAVEPQVLPGETMDVGALRDGFDRAALERAADPTLDEIYLPPEAYVGAPWDGPGLSRMPAPTPTSDDATARVYGPIGDHHPVESSPVDPLADGSHLFGFDRLPADNASRHRERSGPTLPAAMPSTDNESRGPVPYLSN